MSEPKIPDYVALYEVIARLRSGVYTDTAVDNYLSRWNATPGRFTVARRLADRIMQFDKDYA